MRQDDLALPISARDRFHQLPGDFVTARCECGLRATVPQPADMGYYYPDDHYADGAIGAPPFYGLGLMGLLRTLALLYQYGYRYGDLGARLPAGGLLATALGLATRPLRRLLRLLERTNYLELVARKESA